MNRSIQPRCHALAAAAVLALAHLVAHAQSVPAIPANATATGAKTFTWLPLTGWGSYTYEGSYCDAFWCSAADNELPKWVVIGGGANISYNVKPRPGASTGAQALWFKATGLTHLNAQLKLPLNLQSEKRYRITATLQASAPAKLKVGLGNAGVVTAARTIDIPTAGQSIPVDLVFRPHEGGGLGALSLFPLGDGVDYYVDNLTIAPIDADPLNLAGDKGFAVPTAAAPLPMDLMMFGFTENKWGQTAWPALGQTIQRLWDNGTYWAAIEPQRGVYWEGSPTADPQPAVNRLTRFVNQAVGNGAQVLYTMGISPSWATGGNCTLIYSSSNVPQLNGCGEAPATEDDWTRWSQYVYNMAVRYQGQVKYFELWNEPDAMFKGTPAQMVRLAKTARQALTQAETTLGKPGHFKLVGFTPTSVGMSSLDDFLAAGGGQWIDIMSYHSYYHPAGLEGRISADVANLKLLMSAYQLTSKPIWNTEGAPGCSTNAADCPWGSRTPPVDVQRGLHVRALASMWANGVTNFDYYFMEGTDPTNEPWRALATAASGYTTLTPNGEGFAKAREWFTGAKMTSAYQMTGAPVVIQHITDSNGKKLYLLWNTSTSAITVKVPGIQTWYVWNARATDGSSYGLGWDRQVTLQPMSPLFLTQ